MDNSSLNFYETRPDPTPPPPGVEPNFNGTNTNGNVFIIVAVVGIVLATISSAMRVYTKALLTRSFGIDDIMCVFTWIGAVIWTGLNIKQVEQGMGLEVWNDNRTYGQLQSYSKVGVATNTSYFITICLVKVTILMLYLRTFTESKRFRYAVYATLSVLILSHIITIPLYWTGVTPLHCNWTYYPTDEEWYANCKENHDILPIIVFLAALTILLDLVILVLPCPAVWRLHLAKRQKLAIIGILVAGVIVTIASVLRLVYMIHRFYFDADFSNDLVTEFQVNTISTVEIDVAIICACLPTLKAFLKRFLPRLLGSTSASALKPSAYSSFHYNKNTGGGTGTGNKVDRKWKDESHEECLTMNAGGADGGLEDETDGKSRESYAMGEMGGSAG